jgi:hypothetical protein
MNSLYVNGIILNSLHLPTSRLASLPDKILELLPVTNTDTLSVALKEDKVFSNCLTY